jgi:hypothetical protein
LQIERKKRAGHGFGGNEETDQGVRQASDQVMPALTAHGCGQVNSLPAVSGRDIRGIKLPSGLSGMVEGGFLSKVGIVLEEADESLYWMEILVETDIMKAELLAPLMEEANELVSIFVSSLNTAKG